MREQRGGQHDPPHQPPTNISQLVKLKDVRLTDVNGEMF